MTERQADLKRWLAEHERPERPPDHISRRALWIPVLVAVVAGLVAAIVTAMHPKGADDEFSPHVPVLVVRAVQLPTAGRCDLKIRDSEGDTGTLRNYPCLSAGSAEYAYLNPHGNLQASPPLLRADNIIRDFLSGVLGFGLALVVAGAASWFIWRRTLNRRTGHPQPRGQRQETIG